MDAARARALRGAHDYRHVLYQWDSSRVYNAAPKLDRIKAALLVINAADDERNPPETGLMERELEAHPEREAAPHPGQRRHQRTRHDGPREVLCGRVEAAAAGSSEALILGSTTDRSSPQMQAEVIARQGQAHVSRPS
jgi:hypothetical protein